MGSISQIPTNVLAFNFSGTKSTFVLSPEARTAPFIPRYVVHLRVRAFRMPTLESADVVCFSRKIYFTIDPFGSNHARPPVILISRVPGPDSPSHLCPLVFVVTSVPKSRVTPGPSTC